MKLRLSELLGPDTKSRWRIIVASTLAIAAWGIVSQLSGRSLREAEFGATIFGTLVFLAQVGGYCVRSARSERSDWIEKVPRRWLLATAATLFLAVIPGRAAERLVLDRRLRALTRNGDLSAQHAEEVASALDIATAARIELPESTRVQVYQAVKDSCLEHPNSPPFVGSANSIVRYARVEIASPGANAENGLSGPAEAKAALARGSIQVVNVLSHTTTVPTGKADEARDAVSQLTAAIQIASLDSRYNKLVVVALSLRASMYLCLVQPQSALDDAKRIESIGGADLANLLDTEGVALFMLGGRENLEQSIRAFELLLNLEFQPMRISSDPGSVVPFRVDALGNLGKAYYRLGEFELALQASKRALDLINSNQGQLAGSEQQKLHLLKLSYLAIVASHLQLGRIDEAKKTARVWLEKTGDPDARNLVFSLESPQFDRQRWLEYMRPEL